MNPAKRAAVLCLCLFLCLSPGSAPALEPTLEVSQWYDTLVRFVDAVGTRQAYTPGEGNALEYLAARFREMGFSERNGTLTRQWMSAPLPILRKMGWYGGMTNLIAVQKAQSPQAKVLIIGAHYDSMSGTPGAKDNGSGVAALLTLARYFSALPAFPDTELRFIAFAAEEKGEFGSGYYAASLTEEERQRILAVFNIDLITLDEGAADIAFSCNTLGGWTAEGYQSGSPEKPAANRGSRALRRALLDSGYFSPGDEGVTFCVPRHWGDGDHIRFHDAQIDAVTLCFQGNVAEGGSWPRDMHTPEDVLKPYDMERTQQALNVICRALYGLAANHGYGLDGAAGSGD